MRRTTAALLVAALAAALAAAGCVLPAPPDAPDAGVPDGAAIAPAEDAGPPAPPGAAALPVSLAEALAGDAGVPISRDGGATLVDPASSFRVEVAARLVDARLSVLDAQEAVVPADGAAEVAGTSRYSLTPAARLRPGSGYTLRLDGALGREIHDAEGRAFLPASFALRTAGDPPAPAPARRKRGKRRR
jgi:hypothetical protein